MDELSYHHHDPEEAIDALRLRPVVCRVLDDESAHITHWKRQGLHGIGGGVGGNQVILFRGQADTSTGTQNWAVVLKILHAQPVNQPDGPHYWLREVEVFQSGFAADFDCDLSTPKCYGIERFGDAVCWLWLEYIDETVTDWSDAQFIRSARHLGQFNGLYLTRPTLPDYDWMSRDWHRRNLQQITELIVRFRMAADHPLYQAGYPNDSHAHILRLWDERDHYLSALDALPQTICHYDAFRRNLLAREADTVAIDWSFTGTGPVGADLAAYLWVSFVFNNLTARQMDALYEPLLEAYLTGLHDVGWRGEADQVWLGYAASFPVRVLVSAGYDTLLLLNEEQHERFASIVEMPMHDYMRDHVAAVQPVIRRISDDARRLVGLP